MTWEAKIGMLTGLGVIVLIGVLLSAYLGQPASPKMATLPVGASYRNQMTRSPGVPDATADAGRTGVPIIRDTPPQAYAVGHDAPMVAPDMGQAAPGQPTVGAPVAPVPDGRILADVPTPGDRLPIIQLADGGAKAGTVTGGAGQPAKAAVVAGKEYKIVQGDTLAKIAAKFYKSGKPENVQRIVAANPATLKNVNTTLVIGKTLIIPAPPASVVDSGPAPLKIGTDGHVAKNGLMVHPPGATAGDVADAKSSDARTLSPKADVAKAAAAVTTYTVKDGDTLEKIARRISATHYAEVAKQIATLNKIKDPRSLQVGQTLKVPTKA